MHMIWVKFGCPGHGKGPWDGFGAVVKQRTSNDIKNGTFVSTSGKHLSSIDVAENLERNFCSQKYEEAHRGHKINRVVVHHLDVSEIQRPAVEPKFGTLQGSTTRYAFVPLRPGVVGSRHVAGCCAACMRAYRPGLGMTANLEVTGCTCRDSYAQAGIATCCRWTEIEIQRTDAAGVANRRKAAQDLGHKLAHKLSVGMIIAVQARERWGSEDAQYRSGHFWLARVVSAGEQHFLGDGVVRQVTVQRECIQNTLFTKGDIIIAVEWFDRVPDDPTGLTFTKWQGTPTASPPFAVVNSTELRAIDVALIPRVPLLPVARIPPVRRSGRLASVVGATPAARPLPDDTLFDLLPDRDARIRAECW